MTKGFYLPKGDKERRAWLNNFDTQLASIGALLGILPAEITAVHNDTLAVNYMLDNVETFKAEAQERTRYKDLLLDGEIGVPLGALPGLPLFPAAPTAVAAGVFKRIAHLVQRLKNHPNYNEALGKNLGIIGAEKQINLDTAKVQVSLRRSDGNGVALDFVKGLFDGVVVSAGSYPSKVITPSDTPAVEEEPVMVWTEIGRSASSPFIDARPNKTNKPETRYYRISYLKKQVIVGLPSDSITVIANVGSDLATKVK